MILKRFERESDRGLSGAFHCSNISVILNSVIKIILIKKSFSLKQIVLRLLTLGKSQLMRPIDIIDRLWRISNNA